MSHSSSLSKEAEAMLLETSTATLTGQLLSKGYRNVFIPGLVPFRPDLRLVGTAFTLRYVPAREDVSIGTKVDNNTSAQRIAVESVSDGEVLVIDARGDLSAGVLGQILARRMQERGAKGIVTDGAMRDASAFGSLELPVYARGGHGAASTAAHWPVDINVPIGCGGVLVMPGDVVVGDADGVVIIPKQVADEVAQYAHEQEVLESRILREVEQGASILGLYPPDAERLASLLDGDR